MPELDNADLEAGMIPPIIALVKMIVRNQDHVEQPQGGGGGGGHLYMKMDIIKVKKTHN